MNGFLIYFLYQRLQHRKIVSFHELNNLILKNKIYKSQILCQVHVLNGSFQRRIIMFVIRPNKSSRQYRKGYMKKKNIQTDSSLPHNRNCHGLDLILIVLEPESLKYRRTENLLQLTFSLSNFRGLRTFNISIHLSIFGRKCALNWFASLSSFRHRHSPHVLPLVIALLI